MTDLEIAEQCLELVTASHRKLVEARKLVQKHNIPFLALGDRTIHVHLLIEQLEIRIKN